MRVKKLDIFGFKSFAVRQTITFGQGLTGIVGPNGCGKSNVVDALRWVMGEQNPRHLRGGNMQDIIFCGSEKKAPLGFAEVTLTIENSDNDAPLEYNHFTEIEITRRLYKTGESEYEINRKRARLKDISDFFLGTGVGTKAYSIIEQGRVNDIISAKAHDRRLIIEEAAGITKYKSKKAAAERRMEATRVNLNRIIDIKNEIDKRVLVLHKEKEKLLKVQDLKAQIKNIDLHLASLRYLSLSSVLGFLEREKEYLKEESNNNRKASEAQELKFSKALEEYSNKHEKKRLLEELENQHKASLDLLQKDLEYIQSTRHENRNLVSRIAMQLDDINRRQRELSIDIHRYRHEEETAKAESKTSEQTLLSRQQAGQSVIERRQKNIMTERDLQRKIVEKASLAARLQAEITMLQNQEVQKQFDIKQAELDVKQKSDEMALLKDRIDAMMIEYEHGVLRKESLETELKETENLLVGEREKGQILRDNKKRLEDDKLSRSSRLKSLEEIDKRLEWTESGISEVLASEHRHLIKGVIADSIKVKSGYEEMVEKCLLELLDAALVVDNQALLTIAEFLKSKPAARTPFLFLDRAREQQSLSTLSLKNLSDYVEVLDKTHEGLIEHLSRFYLADDLLNALSSWPQARADHCVIVTEQGEMLFPDGRVIFFGEDSDKGILKRKSEMIALQEKIDELSDEIAALNDHIGDNADVIKGLDDKRARSLEDIKPLNVGLVRLEEALKQKNNELTKVDSEVTKLLEKREMLTKDASNSDEKRNALQIEWAEALDDHKNFEDELTDLREARVEVEGEYEAFHHDIRAIEITRAAVLEKIKSLSEALVQAEKNQAHLESQVEAFAQQTSEKEEEELKLDESERHTEKKIVAIRRELEETLRMLLGLRVECENLAKEKALEEHALAEIKAHGRSILDKLHQEEIRLNNAQNDIANLSSLIMDRYRLKIADFVVDYHLQMIDEVKSKNEMMDLQRSLDRMGAVNENAAVEYDELFQRGSFLGAQVDDLSDALNQLESAIKKINKTTEMRFQEAFISINKQFSQVFPRLFNGGKAELVLCSEDDLLNSGIDIIAKPPGKNIGSIDLMSGGEKALTAISLIMAIFLIKPSPFCLLDEVDAPLDEANVSRFSMLIKEMSSLSQFIVITHNRKTMESADQLYGVTMEDAGMSKIVSVHVQQAFETLRQAPPETDLEELRLF